MAHWYIKADSTVQNGLTPATGYHNITNLITAHGALKSTDITDVVYSGVDATESIPLTLAGTIKAYDGATFPVLAIPTTGNGNSIVLKSDTTLNGLTLLTNTNIGIINPSYYVNMDGTNISLLGNKIIFNCSDTTNNSVLFNTTTNAIGRISFVNNSFWIRESGTTFHYFLSTQYPTWTTANQFTITNNSFYLDIPVSISQQFCVSASHQMHIFNNIIMYKNSIGGYLFNTQATGTSEEDYNTRYNFTGTYTFGNISSGGHSSSTNPLYKDATNKDLSLLSNSPCVNAGVSNFYTPSTDILLKIRSGNIDIGAYEIVSIIVNSFDGTPARNGNSYLSTVDSTALLNFISTDSYFNSIAKIGRVEVLYADSSSREKKWIKHFFNGSNFTGRASWSTYSKDGTWQKESVRIEDKDGAVTWLGRNDLGTDQDIFLI